jgi:hypothetical protein
VYFLSVEEFEWRPRQDNPDGSAGKKNQPAETGLDSKNAREQPESGIGKDIVHLR